MSPLWPYLLWLVVWFIPVFVFTFALYWLFTLPLRRQERSRFLLDLLETGYQQGKSAESTVEAISATRDRSVGVWFHLLATHMKSGLGFTDALARVPSLASPQAAAILRVGEKLGDIRKVFPVCRGLLKDGHSQSRNAANYFLLLALIGTPILPLTLATFKKFVIPTFARLGEVFDVDVRPSGMMDVVGLTNWIAAAQIVMAALVCAGVAAYIGGPRLRRWLATLFPAIGDRVMYMAPWRRKRLRRDFAAMLALLLDAGVPEETSLQLAAAATANQVFLANAALATRDLQSGLKLPAALRRFDRDAEFSWRLANAAHEPNGFTAALSGWMESLDARAFQQEQTFSQIVSTGLVLASGVMVALVVVGAFHILVSITNEVALW